MDGVGVFLKRRGGGGVGLVSCNIVVSWELEVGPGSG